MTATATAGKRDRRFWLLSALVLAALAVLVTLGTWQVRRLAWKEGLIARIEARMAAAPVPLAAAEQAFAASGDVDYQPVTLTGHFEHAGEQHFFATHKGASGYYVYTPLRLPDGRAILVNRGFVPFDRKDPATRAEGQVEGDVEIAGLARNPLAEKPSGVYDNDPAKNIYYWKDRQAMARAAGLDPARLLPFFVDADDAPNPGGWPMGGVTLVSLPNNHLQYAVTWYGLALALVGVYLFWIIQARRKG
ncbi:MAG: SURF1 family protein [Notoacmeibacter sp.]|nr:SURF1 family protein [Notoacmeibacter sp.]MCC0033028.1 SURF1 family protein [Brucellaceae bacterium]